VATQTIQNPWWLPFRRPIDPFGAKAREESPTPPLKKKQERGLEKRGHGHDGRNLCVNTFRHDEPGTAAFAALFAK